MSGRSTFLCAQGLSCASGRRSAAPHPTPSQRHALSVKRCISARWRWRPRCDALQRAYTPLQVPQRLAENIGSRACITLAYRALLHTALCLHRSQLRRLRATAREPTYAWVGCVRAGARCSGCASIARCFSRTPHALCPSGPGWGGRLRRRGGAGGWIYTVLPG